jgi:hypothetical protein
MARSRTTLLLLLSLFGHKKYFIHGNVDARGPQKRGAAVLLAPP